MATAEGHMAAGAQAWDLPGGENEDKDGVSYTRCLDCGEDRLQNVAVSAAPQVPHFGFVHQGMSTVPQSRQAGS